MEWGMAEVILDIHKRLYAWKIDEGPKLKCYFFLKRRYDQ